LVEVLKLGDLIDRLIITNIKIHYYNHQKLDERKKENPDYELLNEIQTKVDTINEMRVSLRNEIDKLFKRVITTGIYDVREEKRTYDKHI